MERVAGWLAARGDDEPGRHAALAVLHASARVAALLTEADRPAPPVDEIASRTLDAPEADRLAFLWHGASVAAGEAMALGPQGRGPNGVLVRAVLAHLEAAELSRDDRLELLRLLLLAEGRAQDVDLEPLVALAEEVAGSAKAEGLLLKLRSRVSVRAPELLARVDRFVDAPTAPDGDLLAAYLAEARASRHTRGFQVDLGTLSTAQVLLAADAETRADVLVRALLALAELPFDAFDAHGHLRALASALGRRKLTLDDAQAAGLVAALRRAAPYFVPWNVVVRLISAHAERSGPEGYRDDLQALAESLADQHDAESRKAGGALAALLTPKGADPKELPFDDGPFADLVRASLAGAPAEAAWIALLTHAATGTSASKPSKAWSKEAARRVAAVGPTFADVLVPWLEAARPGPHPSMSKWEEFRYFVLHPSPSELGQSVRDIDVIRGLVWAAGPVDDPRLPRAIASLAARCFQKVRGWGARSPKLGNGALYALGVAPGTAGVAHLSRLAGRVRYVTGQKQIDRALSAAAERAGVSRAEIEEMGVPDYGLVDGARTDDVGGWQAELAVTDARDVELRWISPAGEAQKAPPAALKDTHADEIEALQAERAEVRDVLAGQANRIERLWLSHTSPWRYADWRDRYLDHGLVGIVARALVWTVDGTPALWSDGRLRDVDGAVLPEPPADAPVTLWHPIEADAAAVVAWRDRIDRLGIRQPVKQVWREIYRITPAEEEARLYSRRFAAHLLRQHALVALTRDRGWRYTLIGAWDSDNAPTKEAARWWASWQVERVVTDDDPGHTGYRLVSSDELWFGRIGAHEASPLADVPPLVFSELMRDVDLFVSVCSIGADPGWVPDGHAAYWDSFAYGELTELGRTRAQVVERLLPRLKIRDVATVDGRWLVVRGTLATYRIHLGSGNVMIEDRGYLCIVPERSRREGEEILLPFEGDDVLTVVLSKAFLLAADDRIEDPSILVQIAR